MQWGCFYRVQVSLQVSPVNVIRAEASSEPRLRSVFSYLSIYATCMKIYIRDLGEKWSQQQITDKKNMQINT